MHSSRSQAAGVLCNACRPGPQKRGDWPSWRREGSALRHRAPPEGRKGCRLPSPGGLMRSWQMGVGPHLLLRGSLTSLLCLEPQLLARGGRVSERTSLEPEEQGLGMPLLGGVLLRL